MRYQPTVLIGNAEIDAIKVGAMRLQPGQWIKLDWCSHRSRWVGLSSAGILLAVHHPVQMKQFSTLCNPRRLKR